MKRFILSLAIVLMALPFAAAEDSLERLKRLRKYVDELPAKLEEAKSEVVIEKAIVTVYANDLDNAVDTIGTMWLRYPTKVIKLVVRAPKELTVEELIEELEKPADVSASKELSDTFSQRLHSIAMQHSELKTLLDKEPTNWRAHVEWIEEKTGLRNIVGDANWIERTRRATWLMTLRHNQLASVRFEK